MRASLKRALFLAILALLLAVALAYAFWPRAVAVDLAEVERGDVRLTVDGEGRAQVRDVYVVSAPLAGIISRIDLRAGDPVEGGETLITSLEETEPTFLDARSRARIEAEIQAAEAAYDLARAELERAEAELALARSDLRRTETLHERGTATERELEEARIRLRTQDALVRTARAALRMRLAEEQTVRAALIEPGTSSHPAGHTASCCIPIRAPISGEVLRVLQESEVVVVAGTPLIEIGEPDDLEIVVDLPSEQAVRVDSGDAVIIDNWGGDETIMGRVRRVEPYAFTEISALGVEEQRVNVLIDFENLAPGEGRLGHGYRVLTRIVVEERADVLRVPAGALFRRAEQWAVFAREDGRARVRDVRVGLNNGLYGEILDGLDAGAEVVLYPSDTIEDGLRVTERPRQ